MTPRQVQRVFVGLCARVTQEHPGERVGAKIYELLRQCLTHRVPHRSRIEQKLGGLLCHRTNHVWMAVSCRCHGVPTVRVQPLGAVFIDQPRAPPAHRDDRELSVYRKEGGELLQHGKCPVDISPAHSSPPNARFIACMAWPPAPLTRLSIATLT